MKRIFKLGLFLSAFTLLACAPEKGSKEWCEDLKEKPKGDWSTNDAKEFTKYCVLKQKPE